MWNKWRRLIRPILFFQCVCILFSTPFVFYWAYAASKIPTQMITYENYKLTWDSQSQVGEDGQVNLKIFNSSTNSNQENLIKPGEKGSSVISILNASDTPVHYYATIYTTHKGIGIPLTVDINTDNQNATETDFIPDGVDADQYRSIEGIADATDRIDWTVSWNWNFYKNYLADRMDTAISKQDEANVTVTLFIQVDEVGSSENTDNNQSNTNNESTNNTKSNTDNSSSNNQSTTNNTNKNQTSINKHSMDYIKKTKFKNYSWRKVSITPSIVHTGDNTNMRIYLMAVFAALLILFFLKRNKDDKENT